MAEQIPYAVAESLINRLASMAFREFGRIYSVMNELETLEKTLEIVRAGLLDAENGQQQSNAEDKQQQQSHAVRNWIKRLKNDVIHPADDLLDEFLIEEMREEIDEAPKNKVKQVLHSLSPQKIVFRHKMALEIEKVQKNIDNVVKDMSILNLGKNVVVVTEQSNNEERETASYVLESDIIGRDNDKKEITKLLRQPNEYHNVSLIAIVGIGGLGKTTLAQLVYNDGEVQNLFEKCMWVCVSDNFDVKTIVKKILGSLTKSSIDDKLSLDDLQNMLRDHLTGKRYLLVLDDIWNESFEKWDKLRTYLMCGAQNSKIVVTTRSKVVADTMGVNVSYTVKGLTPLESWNLLENIITRGNKTKGVNQTLELIGKKIARKCSGVPLAIRTLGGLLQNKSEEKQWIGVLQGDFWKLCKDKESIMPVLKLSYQNLSPQQRQCFVYCSLFPKDWEIEKDDLIKLWMAQGYLECEAKNQLMEDIGNQIVNILLMKSFFQEAKVDDKGDIHSFKMHDLIHDLAMQLGGNDCCYLDRETKSNVGIPMHVMLKNDDIGLLESINASRMRTLILLPANEESLNENDLSFILNFKTLRVLKISNCSLSTLCDSIEKFKHLRYLSLRHCEGLESFFEFKSYIVCLQTLRLTGCDQFVLFRKDVSKLINLKHVILEANNFNDSDEKVISRVEKLGLGGLYKSVLFSNGVFSLTNLVEISLTKGSKLEYLPPVERLPFLKSLDLRHLYKLEYICYEEPLLPETFFPSLEYLNLTNCYKLKGWRGTKDGVCNFSQSHSLSLPSFPPCLSYLIIYQCYDLSYLHMPTFPTLDKRLNFFSSNIHALEATLNMASSKYSTDFVALSKLKYLAIGGGALYVHKISKDWFKNLTSLEHLCISYLYGSGCKDLEIWLPSLQKLEVHNCSNLRALPDWICNILSLQHITIKYCYELASLPEELPRLSKLQTLEVIACPLLLEECKKETSETWPKIAHIPNLILKRNEFY